MKIILKKIRKSSERGQAIILVAFSIVGMVAIVGLMIDGGMLLIEYARLKRGIDAASIAAASQFRRDFAGADLVKAGEEFLKFNQSDAYAVEISTCDCPPDNPDADNDRVCDVDPTWNLDDALCPPFVGPNHRKMVRITANRRVEFGFIRIVGINETTIRATSVGEAASIDMVLLLDTSNSMAYETTGDLLKSDSATASSPGDNPEVCNNDPSRRCEPMGKVKDAAKELLSYLFFPYDRVALVTTTGQGANIGNREPVTVLGLNENEVDITAAIDSIKVFQPDRCPYPWNTDPNREYPCLAFDGPPEDANSKFVQPSCIIQNYGTPDQDPSTCGPSNIGGGLYEAGYQFAAGRQDAFWAVIALFSGPANAFNPLGEPDRTCPADTWDLPGGSGFCRDEDEMPATYVPPPISDITAFTNYTSAYDWTQYYVDDKYDWGGPSRHHFTIDPITKAVVFPADYDADDYARDGADYITSPPDGATSKGQGATLYSICMGRVCKSYKNINDPASAELLGLYMANYAGDQYDALGDVNRKANHGLYRYAENSDVVESIFLEIAKNILTRISQ